MDRKKIVTEDVEMSKNFDFIFRNAFGNPIIFTDTPSSAGMKANTWGKVKDATDVIFVKFPDGKTVKIATTPVS